MLILIFQNNKKMFQRLNLLYPFSFVAYFQILHDLKHVRTVRGSICYRAKVVTHLLLLGHYMDACTFSVGNKMNVPPNPLGLIMSARL